MAAAETEAARREELSAARDELIAEAVDRMQQEWTGRDAQWEKTVELLHFELAEKTRAAAEADEGAALLLSFLSQMQIAVQDELQRLQAHAKLI